MSDELGEYGRQMLLALWERGPALPIELAVRCYSFPDEIAGSLKRLQNAGLVEMQSITASSLAGELVYLSDKGRQMAAGTREEATA